MAILTSALRHKHAHEGMGSASVYHEDVQGNERCIQFRSLSSGCGSLFRREIRGLRFADHVLGDGPRFREHACKPDVEGVVSKRVDYAYARDIGDATHGLWPSRPRARTASAPP